MICIQSLDHTVLLRNSNKLNQDDFGARKTMKSRTCNLCVDVTWKTARRMNNAK